MKRNSLLLTLGLLAAITGCSDLFDPEQREHQFLSVSTGGEHSCAVATDGGIYCWGRGRDGETGDFRWTDRSTPTRIAGDSLYVSVVSGYYHSCGLTESGVAVCWGWNPYGQLGNGEAYGAHGPGLVTGGLRFSKLTAGAYHTCGLTADGEAFRWGHNEYGQLGTGSAEGTAAPTPVAGELRFKDLSAGALHTCGVSVDGAAWCWGLNRHGQLGDGTVVGAPEPRRVAGGHRFEAISAGVSHTCALSSARAAWCWGTNEFGELGNGSLGRPGLPEITVPDNVVGKYTFDSISAGAHTTCAVTTDGRGMCWGRGAFGQIGDGTTYHRNTPRYVFSQGTRFVEISARGNTHVCGLTRSRAVYCWGSGEKGQLGSRQTTHSTTPVRVTNTN